MLPLLVALTTFQGTSDYHGFVRHDFKCDQLDAIVVEPKKPRKGRPWIWRTEFFDHRPMVDLALLEKGYTLAHLAVGNTFGCPAAMGSFGVFYRTLTGPEWKLNPRVVLEGFSRGGLYAYNWAMRNPSKVMAIYGDAPVCDFRTWPYGGAGAARSTDDWNKLISDYGFPSEKAALEYPFQPVNCLDALATAHVPIIHVVGGADEVVPVAANSDKVEATYRRLGGTIEVIRKPGGLHHPHSLDDPTPVVEFLLKHEKDTACAPISTMIAAPNPESRYDSAGWSGRSWQDQFQDGARAAKKPEAKIALVGDSITQGFGGWGRQTGAPGAEACAKWLGGPNAIANLGISGDRVQHVLWRIQHGALDGCRAKVILIMIGINNSGDDSPRDVVRGIEQVAQEASRVCPESTVLIQALFPTGQSPRDPRRKWCVDVNRGLRRLDEAGSISLGIRDHRLMLQADGTQQPNLFASDGLHLAAAGYDVWAEAIHRTIEKLGTKPEL